MPRASSSQAMMAGARHLDRGREAASRNAASLPKGDQARLVLPVPAYIGSIGRQSLSL